MICKRGKCTKVNGMEVYIKIMNYIWCFREDKKIICRKLDMRREHKKIYALFFKEKK